MAECILPRAAQVPRPDGKPRVSSSVPCGCEFNTKLVQEKTLTFSVGALSSLTVQMFHTVCNIQGDPEGSDPPIKLNIVLMHYICIVTKMLYIYIYIYIYLFFLQIFA